jgi:hypothetical protein
LLASAPRKSKPVAVAMGLLAGMPPMLPTLLPNRPLRRSLRLSWWPSSMPARIACSIPPAFSFVVRSVWLKMLVRSLALLYALIDIVPAALTALPGNTFW